MEDRNHCMHGYSTTTVLLANCYRMKCVEKHVHKKIDRSEMKKKSYNGPCCSTYVDGASYAVL